MSALAAELGISIANKFLHLDASAAKAMAERTSIPNRVKHMAIRFLFLQQMVKEKQIVLRKVPGEKNRADLMTKPVTRSVLEKLRPSLGLAVAVASAALPLVEGTTPALEPGVLQEVLQHTSVYAIQVAISWPSALMGAMTMLTVIASCLVIFRFHKKKRSSNTVEKMVQGPVTHTSLKHSGEPGRFVPLGESSWGA